MQTVVVQPGSSLSSADHNFFCDTGWGRSSSKSDRIVRTATSHVKVGDNWLAAMVWMGRRHRNKPDGTFTHLFDRLLHVHGTQEAVLHHVQRNLLQVETTYTQQVGRAQLRKTHKRAITNIQQNSSHRSSSANRWRGAWSLQKC